MDSSRPFKQYTPGQRGNAPRRTAAEWDKHKELLTNLYADNVSRADMQRRLAELDFEVTMGQLVRKTTAWGLTQGNTAASAPASGGPRSSQEDAITSSADTTTIKMAYDSCQPAGSEAAYYSQDGLEVNDNADHRRFNEFRFDQLDGKIDTEKHENVGVAKSSHTDRVAPRVKNNILTQTPLPAPMLCRCQTLFEILKADDKVDWPHLADYVSGACEEVLTVGHIVAVLLIARVAEPSPQIVKVLRHTSWSVFYHLCWHDHNTIAYVLCRHLAQTHDQMLNEVAICRRDLIHLLPALLKDEVACKYRRQVDWQASQIAAWKFDAIPYNSTAVRRCLSECKTILLEEAPDIATYLHQKRKCWPACWPRHEHTLLEDCFGTLDLRKIARYVSAKMLSKLELAYPEVKTTAARLCVIIYAAAVLFTTELRIQVQSSSADTEWRGIEILVTRCIEALSGDEFDTVNDYLYTGSYSSDDILQARVSLRIKIPVLLRNCDPDQSFFSPLAPICASLTFRSSWELSRWTLENLASLLPALEQLQEEQLQVVSNHIGQLRGNTDNLTQAADQASLLSASSHSSYRKFLALAHRLAAQRSTISVYSYSTKTSSKWSGYMSVDSWRLENTFATEKMSPAESVSAQSYELPTPMCEDDLDTARNIQKS